MTRQDPVATCQRYALDKSKNCTNIATVWTVLDKYYYLSAQISNASHGHFFIDHVFTTII